MTNPIKGYRELNATELKLINEGKELAELVGAYVERLRALNGISKTDEIMPALDQRWISIGATKLQEGFMAVIRGIAKPSTF